MKQEDFTRRYSYDPVADLLGSGGFGKVFKAWDNDAECYVAIKMQSVDPRYPGLRLSEEVEKAARLRHPNVARYKECYTFSTMDGTKDIAVMSYYEDGSLDKLLASDKLGREDIFSLLTEILEGIAYLHSEGIIHRDLKPQNVLILHHRGRYMPKITDFGISKQLDDGESSAVSNSVLGGTRSYASPEQLKDSTIRKNTDLWSFGVIAFQMLVGKLPFDCGKYSATSEEGRLEQFRQMTSGVLPEALNDVPEPWQRLIRECLTVDNEKRIAHAEDCLAIIHGGNATAVDPEPIAIPVEAVEVIPTPTPAPQPTPKPKVEPKSTPKPKPSAPATPASKKRSKWWLWLLLLAIVGGGVFAYLSSQPKDNPKLTPEPKTIVPDTIKEVDSVEIVAPVFEPEQPDVEPEPEPTPVPDPVLRLTSNRRVTVEHGGGNGTIRYSLENPVSGVDLSVSDDASWLTTSRSGNSINYSASANESQSSRTATITVSYGDQGFEVAITQSGKPAPAPDPVLRLMSNSRVTVEHGGGNGTIRYTLENPVSGVDLSVSDDASWLTTSRSGNTISYSASANESQSSRTATITVSYGGQSFEVAITQSGKPARGTINGHEWVDLGLPSGLKWATCNVGASNPGDYGNLYAWGEITPALNGDYSVDNCSTFEQNIGDIAGTSRDAARQNWGGSWRMPRASEIDELVEHCTRTWTTQNGHNGYKFTGPNGNSIFLPAAGVRGSGSTSSRGVGSSGFYWSSTPDESDTRDACNLYFDRGYFDRDEWGYRSVGLSVRPVSE